MRFRRGVSINFFLWCFFLFFVCKHTVRATDQIRNTELHVAATLGDSDSISQTAQQLIRSGNDLLKAADRISEKHDCSIDRELVELGAALEKASDALKQIEPMLVETKRVNLLDLFKLKPPAVKIAGENLQRLVSYRAALDSLAAAGRKLTSLDPIGTAEPPVEAEKMLKQAGQSLLDLDERSGIGFHLLNAGEAMETFRLATLHYDKVACANAARLMGQMVGLAGENLDGSTSILAQSEAAKLLGLSLYTMSEHMPTPTLDDLDHALELYVKSLLQFSESLSKRAAIIRSLNPPAEAAGAAVLQQFASSMDEGAVRSTQTASHIDEARRTLMHAVEFRGSAEDLGLTIESAGARLKEFGVFAAVVETGDALQQAGKLMANHQPQLAADVLQKSGLKIVGGEEPLTLEDKLRHP